MNIGKSLNVAMAQHDMDTRTVAQAMQVGEQRIRQIKKMPGVKPATLERLAAVFNMRVSEFVALGE